ncbi:MAG: hypothetical protein Q8L66_11900 [Caulobacter sp.]|nr:hypothetical protein [Caulobacter sp.]
MNRFALLAAGCAALALAGCDHPDAKRQRAEQALKVVSKLDCPETQGELKRVSAAADGRSCAYSADGAEVNLTIVPLENGDAAAALAPIEAQLRTLMPARAADKAGVKADAGDDEQVDIRLPGISIRANDAGANINVAGARINASDDSAEIRISRNVDIEREGRGDRRRDEGVFSRLILASDKSTTDWKMVAYDARGPKGGPLVVATLKARADGDGDHDVLDDVDDLVRLNVGGRHKGRIRLGRD